MYINVKNFTQCQLIKYTPKCLEVRLTVNSKMHQNVLKDVQRKNKWMDIVSAKYKQTLIS